MRIIWLLLLSCFHIDAYPCASESRVARAESELSETYQRVWAHADEERRMLLERAQVAWFQYRQANCELLPARIDCVASMTSARTLELRILDLTNTNVRIILPRDEPLACDLLPHQR